MSGGGASPRAVLVRHFLAQFASFESLSASGEFKGVVVAVLALLAAPGYYVAVMAIHGMPVTSVFLAGRLAPQLWLWSQEWVVLSCSLATVAVFVAVQWQSFVLQGRDYRILGVLPLSRRTVVAAKLASLALAVAGLHLAVNGLAALALPIASPLGYLRSAGALQLVLLCQTVFVCGAIVAAQALVSFALPLRLAGRASLALQAGILLAVAFLIVTEGALSRLAFAMHDRPHPVNLFVPVAWFVGLYEWLLGGEGAEVLARARLAAVATMAAALGALACCTLGYRDVEGREAAPLRASSWWRRLRARSLAPEGPPTAWAVASFVSASLGRSPLQALVARAWWVLGAAFSLSGLVGLAWTADGHSASAIPSAPLCAPAILLPFFGLLGLRISAALPVSLAANWLFRLTERQGASDYARGVRLAALRTVVLPCLGVLALGYGVLLGPRLAFTLLVFALAVALVTIEWLFFDFPKVPFTCSYQPGKAKLAARWPLYGAVGLVYCGALPALAEWLVRHPWPLLLAAALLLSARAGLRAASLRRAAAGPGLVFEDVAPAYVTGLALDD